MAVVSDEKLGWRVVVGGRQRSAAAMRKLRSIEKELQSRYALFNE